MVWWWQVKPLPDARRPLATATRRSASLTATLATTRYKQKKREPPSIYMLILSLHIATDRCCNFTPQTTTTTSINACLLHFSGTSQAFVLMMLMVLMMCRTPGLHTTPRAWSNTQASPSIHNLSVCAGCTYALYMYSLPDSTYQPTRILPETALGVTPQHTSRNACIIRWVAVLSAPTTRPFD